MKPANILMTPGGDTVLVDIGGILGLDGRSRAAERTGTRGYIAPEAVTGGEPGTAADRYSLGAVAWFLLAGHEPPDQATVDQLRLELADAPLVAGRGDVVEHVLAMLDPDPAERPRPLANWVAQLRRSSLVALPGEMGVPSAPARDPAAPGTNPPPDDERLRTYPEHGTRASASQGFDRIAPSDRTAAGVIVARHLKLRVRRHVMLDDVSLTVRPGEVVGLVGPPEAGTTVLLSVLAGLVPPDGGTVEVDGRNPWRSRRAALGLVGLMSVDRSPDGRLRVAESLEYPVAVAGFRLGSRRHEVGRLLDAVGLAGRERDRVSSLSDASMRKLALAHALANDPVLLLADRPLDALDPMSSRELAEILGRCLRGRSGVVTSRGVRIETICHRLAVMEAGRIMGTSQVTPAEPGPSSSNPLPIGFNAPAPAPAAPEEWSP